MTRGRIPRNPEGATNLENQNPPVDGRLAEVVRLLADMLRQQQQYNERPLRAKKWIIDLERTYKICGCTDDQKVLYARYLFQGEAGIWWDTRRQLLVGELGSLAALSWERFKEEFDNRFFLNSVKQLKAQDFAYLTQGNLTVEEYATKFMELGRSCHILSTLGLTAQIISERKRTSLYVAEESSERKKMFTGSEKGKGIETGSSMPIAFPPCGECGKHHGGKCRIALGTFFKCGQLGHMIKDCPSVTLRKEIKGISLNGD
ncbi:uncharacterized protein LOC121255154 [Juglans microcarpa x Juglans regia]|uniref:uncharacterized protein LOC121255154 n=1 Tax=Juglans microcarpa x Juglans regia TaxID=2249226 RepID=UPI001B7F6BC3|nr:uncharacterized protein LOC121255154 [Juglans microcarpa x Juglans regia]